MFDIGWTELLLIGIVALIVVGPKDLPVMFRTLGRFTAKIRAMGREFSRAMEQAADESGVKDVARDIKAATNLRQTGIDALKDAATKFESWDPKRTSPSASAAAAATATATTTAKAAAPAADGVPVAAPEPNRGPSTAALTAAQEARRAERLAAVSKPAPDAPETAAPGRSADA
ncbi:MAG: Sec-independent protein translocase protein TatB [Gemmobacter sp.]